MIKIYGKPNCVFCDRAKKLSTSRAMEYNYIELDVGQPRLPDVEYISRDDFMKLFPEARAVPQILVDGVHVGGFKELQEYLKESA